MAIELTEAAADRVRTHLHKRGIGVGLRLGIKKTGCSGFAYVVNYADEIGPGDAVFEVHGVKVIVDPVSLPLIDGWTATRQLKADPVTRAIPVIALTAHAMAGDREKAIEAGCDDYDSKPVEFPRLLDKIEAFLERRAAP